MHNLNNKGPYILGFNQVCKYVINNGFNKSAAINPRSVWSAVMNPRSFWGAAANPRGLGNVARKPRNYWDALKLMFGYLSLGGAGYEINKASNTVGQINTLANKALTDNHSIRLEPAQIRELHRSINNTGYAGYGFNGSDIPRLKGL